jgi:hypothetical protein
MNAVLDINITKADKSKLDTISLENIPFGRMFTDHMLVAEYSNGVWKNVEIKPYQPMSMDPSLAALHYGQSIFEGIKAYQTKKVKLLYSDLMKILSDLIFRQLECKCQPFLKKSLLMECVN